MLRKHIASAIVVIPALFLASASCSRADELCALICDCEHCGDLAESAECEALSMDQEIAEIYDCESAWDSWAECVENNGECREDDATFTTLELDYCASFQDMGTPCGSNADCQQPDLICNLGSCMRRTCNSQPTLPCNSDVDCPPGQDLCADVRQALIDCEQGAADIVIGTGNGRIGPPQPGID